jgi:hypothetical protein
LLAANTVADCPNGTAGYLSAEARAAQPPGFPYTLTPGAESLLPRSDPDGSTHNLLLTLRRISSDCLRAEPVPGATVVSRGRGCTLIRYSRRAAAVTAVLP